jgi:hypothetical protein
MSSLLPPQGSAVAAAAAVAFQTYPPQMNVISTEAAHSLIVSSAVERSLYLLLSLQSPLPFCLSFRGDVQLPLQLLLPVPLFVIPQGSAVAVASR